MPDQYSYAVPEEKTDRAKPSFKLYFLNLPKYPDSPLFLEA
jgi:hypothetical protein